MSAYGFPRSGGITRASARRRVTSIVLAVLGAASSLACTSGHQLSEPLPFELLEATIAELQAAMTAGTTTSRDLVAAYLARIDAYDQAGPRLNAIITINPRALQEATELDKERARQGARGALHGIPIILKDNFDTFDMPTTAAAKALEGSMPPDDAFQVRRLRKAGAVILAKANLHELAWSWETFSSLGGQTLNPYNLSRNPGGSSGGTGAAIAANFAAVGMGTDTCGSIRVPSSHNSLVGIRPTRGLSSVDGIVPLALTQDTSGPMARNVEDVAIVLEATVGFDPKDPVTALGVGKIPHTYTRFLDSGALRGSRIGMFRELFGESDADQEVNDIVRRAAEEMTAQGAEMIAVDSQSIADILALPDLTEDEFRTHLEVYLAATPDAPVKTLREIVDSGLAHPGVQHYLQRSLDSDAFGSTEYKDKLLRRDELRVAILSLMAERRLDALLYPTVNQPPAPLGLDYQPGAMPNCDLSARSGLPAITVPAGYTANGLPTGVELLGREFDEPTLIGLAYAYEQATRHRRPPDTTPALQ